MTTTDEPTRLSDADVAAARLLIAIGKRERTRQEAWVEAVAGNDLAKYNETASLMRSGWAPTLSRDTALSRATTIQQRSSVENFDNIEGLDDLENPGLG